MFLMIQKIRSFSLDMDYTIKKDCTVNKTSWLRYSTENEYLSSGEVIRDRLPLLFQFLGGGAT